MERNIKLLAMFNFFTDFILFAPIAILYFSHVSGSFALGMSVFSITMLTSAIFEIPTGIFSDLIGRKNTVILGALAAIFGAVFYAAADSYWILIIGAACEGLSRAFYSGNNDALLHDTLTTLHKQGRYHEYLGKTSSLFQIALATSAILGGILAQWSFSIVMWASVTPKILALVSALFLRDPKLHNRESSNIYNHLYESIEQFKKNKTLRLLTITAAIKYALGESSYLFRSAFLSLVWPLWAIGVGNAGSNIGAALSYFFSGKILDRFKAKRTLTFEIIYNRVANIIPLIFTNSITPIVMFTTSLTYGVGDVAMDTLLQKEFTQKQRATMGSLGSLAGSILFGIVAVALGKVGDMYGPVKALLLAQALLLIPLYFYKKIFTNNTV